MSTFGQSDIQALINAGNGFGAAVLGEACDWRRPQSAINAAAPIGTSLGTLPAYFNPDFKFKGVAPSLYGKSVYGALFDASATQVGDYLFGPSGTYFIAVQNGLLTTAVVQCNGLISISRTAGVTLAHENDYGGRSDATDTPILSGWPASILKGGRQEAGRADLPGDPSMGGYAVLLPAMFGVIVKTSDRIKDDLGRAMTVNTAERTSLGWRLEATFAEA